MTFTKEHRRGDQIYYEIVEGYRDKNGKVRHRRVKWLGKNKTAPPDPIPLEGVDLAEIAVRLMDGTLTPDGVIDVLSRIGKKPADLTRLEAVGVRFEFAQKKVVIYLFPKGYTWKVSDPRAPRAKKSSVGSARAGANASSRSKAKQK